MDISRLNNVDRNSELICQYDMPNCVLDALPFGDVHKLRLQEEGGRWSKKSTFCKLLYHRKCKRRGVGGQKKPNLVNVVCERPLIPNTC